MIIQAVGNASRRRIKIGDIVMCTVKKAVPQGGVKKGEKVRAVLVRTKAPIKRKDGTTVRFDDNAVVLINADKTLRATRVFGPVALELQGKGFNRLISLASEVL